MRRHERNDHKMKESINSQQSKHQANIIKSNFDPIVIAPQETSQIAAQDLMRGSANGTVNSSPLIMKLDGIQETPSMTRQNDDDLSTVTITPRIKPRNSSSHEKTAYKVSEPEPRHGKDESMVGAEKVVDEVNDTEYSDKILLKHTELGLFNELFSFSPVNRQRKTS